ncbi:uncharacterized protein LOC143235031 isoform X2 [Tachypleus tridentatus]
MLLSTRMGVKFEVRVWLWSGLEGPLIIFQFMMNAIIVDILDTGLETVLSLNEIAITLEDTSRNPGPDLDLAENKMMITVKAIQLVRALHLLKIKNPSRSPSEEKGQEDNGVRNGDEESEWNKSRERSHSRSRSISRSRSDSKSPAASQNGSTDKEQDDDADSEHHERQSSSR